MKTLRSKLQGMWNYYGLIGNSRRMKLNYDETRRTLYKWLNRRSQRPSMTWREIDRLMERFQIPRPRIVEKKDQKMPCQQEFSFCQRIVGFLFPTRRPAAHARAS